MRVSPARFRVARRATAITAAGKKAPRGTRFRFRLSTPASVTITIRARSAGLRSGKRCVKPTRKLRRAGAKRCTRYRTTGKLTRRDRAAGNHRVRFSGRLGKRRLRPNRYEAILRAGNPAGRSKPITRRFTIVR